MSTIFYYRYLIKLIGMESESIVVEQQTTPDQRKDYPNVDSKFLDSVSSIQNSSQICVSKLEAQISNSPIDSQFNQKNLSNPIQMIPDQVDKTLQENELLSEESESENIRTLMKPGREQKFKRSTNNSHKKFISVARRWLFKNNGTEVKLAFQNKFKAFRSTRTYFFIILAFIRCVMSEQKKIQFRSHFEREVKAKITEYERQIESTTLENMKSFRGDEITDLRFSIKACDVYFQGDIEKSIECVYKKDKTVVVKKHHFQEALKTVKAIELQLLLPHSVEDMLSQFGNRKSKGKSSTIQNSNVNNSKLEPTNDQGIHFLFPDFFGLNTGFAFNQVSFKKNSIQIRKTETIEEQFNFDEQEREIEVQRFGMLEPRTKKIINMVVIPPKLELYEPIKIDSYEKRACSIGFRPYQKQ